VRSEEEAFFLTPLDPEVRIHRDEPVALDKEDELVDLAHQESLKVGGREPH
jgi:hypothetical protein